jgi:hypothetical protein
MIKSFILAFMMLVASPFLSALELDPLGSLGEDVYSKTLNCAGSTISFTRKKNQLPLFLINGKKVEINSSCYSSIECTNYKGKDAVLLVETPACGGNAVPESYVVFSLDSLTKSVLTYKAAKKARLTD